MVKHICKFNELILTKDMIYVCKKEYDLITLRYTVYVYIHIKGLIKLPFQRWGNFRRCGYYNGLFKFDYTRAIQNQTEFVILENEQCDAEFVVICNQNLTVE